MKPNERTPVRGNAIAIKVICESCRVVSLRIRIDEVDIIKRDTSVIALDNVDHWSNFVLSGACELAVGDLNRDRVLSEVVGKLGVANHGDLAVACNGDLLEVYASPYKYRFRQPIVRQRCDGRGDVRILT